MCVCVCVIDGIGGVNVELRLMMSGICYVVKDIYVN